MRDRFPFTIACAAAALAFAHSSVAAEPDPAEELFNQGVDNMEAGQFEKACPAIEQSYRLDPRPGTLFALAECEAQRGRIATALSRYRQYLAMYEQFAPAKQAQQKDRADTSRMQSAALAPQVPMLTLGLPRAAPEGTNVWRDGEKLAGAALGVASAVDPGEHVIGLELPGGDMIERRVTIEKGQRLDLVLEMPTPDPAKPSPTAPEPTPQPPSMRSPPPLKARPTAPVPRPLETAAGTRETGTGGRRIGMAISGGAGIAGIVLGATTGVLAIDSKNIVDTHCDDAGGNRMECDSAGVSAGERLKKLGTASTVGFVVGSAGLVTAAVMFFTGPRTTPTKAGARVHSSTPVTADLTAVGTGPGVVLRGAF